MSNPGQSPRSFLRITNAYSRESADKQVAKLTAVLPPYMSAGACPAGGSLEVGAFYPTHMEPSVVMATVAHSLLEAASND